MGGGGGERRDLALCANKGAFLFITAVHLMILHIHYCLPPQWCCVLEYQLLHWPRADLGQGQVEYQWDLVLETSLTRVVLQRYLANELCLVGEMSVI